MEFATSLSTGKTYEAPKVNYAQAKTLKLVCPVCKEKVFKRVRKIPHETHMFAHHKGGSPDCELYFPAVTYGALVTTDKNIQRGQTFEQFIKDIDANIESLLVNSRLINSPIDHRNLNTLGSVVDEYSRNLFPSFSAVEKAALEDWTCDSDDACAIAELILEFYTRDGARFIDKLFSKWFIYYIFLMDRRSDSSAILSILVKDSNQFSTLAGLFLHGLSLFYSDEDLSVFFNIFSKHTELFCKNIAKNKIAKTFFTPAPRQKLKTFATLFTLPGGEKFKGKFPYEDFDGRGILDFPNGARYIGEFSKGKYHGQGVLTLRDGLRYLGLFKRGDYNGEGALTKPNGDKYVGEFVDGNFNGKGTYTFSDKRILHSGQWVNGKPDGFNLSRLPRLFRSLIFKIKG